MGNRLVMLHWLHLNTATWLINAISSRAYQGFCPVDVPPENFRLEVFEAHSSNVNQKTLSKPHLVLAAQMSNAGMLLFINAFLNSLDDACQRLFGIDEHFLNRKHSYANTFVDLAHRKKAFDVVAGRPQARRLFR